MSSDQGEQGGALAGCYSWLWFIVFMLGNLAIIVGFFVALAKPWYSPEDWQRLTRLRQACRGKSIHQFLKENPQWKNDPTFVNAPVEHTILDKMLWYLPIIGLLWWLAGGYVAPKLPATPVKQQPPPQPAVAADSTAEPAAAATPGSYKIVCAYCGGTIVTELTPGQPINCPHCGAALKVPNA